MPAAFVRGPGKKIRPSPFFGEAGPERKIPVRRKRLEELNTIPSDGKLVIAVDIDGTVADSGRVDFANAFKSPGELMKARPIPAARRAIRRLYRAGHKIVFHSSRLECQRKVTEKWLKRHGFPYHRLELRKFAAHLYIDDRAHHANDWEKVLKIAGVSEEGASNAARRRAAAWEKSSRRSKDRNRAIKSK